MSTRGAGTESVAGGERSDRAPHQATAFGLWLRSDVELAGLPGPPPGRGASGPDVTIEARALELPFALPQLGRERSATVGVDRSGQCQEARDEDPQAPEPASLGRFVRHADGCWFVWPGFATVRVRGGSEVVVDRSPGVDPHQLQAALLGPVASVLLLQRGLLPLHAGALSIEGRAVAIAAASGGGKSTLVGTLAARGNGFLSDDVTALALDGERPLAFASYPQQKLTPLSQAWLGHAAEGAPLVNPDEDKRLFGLEQPPCVDPLPLDRLYVLERGALSIEPIERREALFLLLRHCHRAPLLHHAVGSAELMRRAARVVSQVPLYRLRRPFELGRLAECAAAIEAHVRGARVA